MPRDRSYHRHRRGERLRNRQRHKRFKRGKIFASQRCSIRAGNVYTKENDDMWLNLGWNRHGLHKVPKTCPQQLSAVFADEADWDFFSTQVELLISHYESTTGMAYFVGCLTMCVFPPACCCVMPFLARFKTRKHFENALTRYTESWNVKFFAMNKSPWRLQ